MSAGFIPMVSTTPPPIEEDDNEDFTDFMDGEAEFGEFSSPIEEEKYSFSPLNSPPEINNSFSFQEEENIQVLQQKDACKEVESILQESENCEQNIEDLTNTHNHNVVKDDIIQTMKKTLEHDTENDALKEFDKKDEDMQNGHAENLPSVTSNSAEGDPVESKSPIKDDLNDEDDSEMEDWMDFTDAAESQSSGNKITEQNEISFPNASEISEPQTFNESPTDQNSEESFRSEQIPENHSEHSVSLKETILEKKESPEPDDKTEETPHVGEEDKINNTIPLKSSEGVSEVTDDDFAEFHSVAHGDDEVKFEQSQNDSKNDEKQLDSFTPSDDDFADFASNTQFEPSDAVINVENIGNSNPASENKGEAFECDFGAFESTPADDADGFADFSKAETSTAPSAFENEAKDSDFGDFATESGQDDFGDFGNSESNSDFTWATSVPQTVIKVLTTREKLGNYLHHYKKGKEAETDEADNVSLLDERMRSDILSKDSETHSTTSVESVGITCPGEVWDQLEDIDNTIALKFVWNGSNHNKHLLDSLGLQTQNILFSGAKQAYYVPTYYAAGLGMIDPSKGILKPMSAAEKITAISPSEKTSPATQEDISSPTESYPEWKTVADKHGSNTALDGNGSWSSSDSSTVKSDFLNNYGVLGSGPSPPVATPDVSVPAPMNLDYFDNLPSMLASEKSPVRTDLIDPELLELTTAPTTDPPPPPKDSGSATLSKILASIKSAGNSTMTTITAGQNETKWEEEESKLSQEARAVLQRLPDLSFMRSKVLVFPINMSRVNMDGDI